MPYKDPSVRKTKHKAYSAKYYEDNKPKILAETKRLRREKRAAWLTYKTTLSCSHCGFSHPAVIDFHHPPGTKKHSANSLVKNGKYTKAYEEATKCVILCANCHRIHHFNEKGAEAPSIQAASSPSSASDSSSSDSTS